MNGTAYVDHLLRNREQVSADLQSDSKVLGNTKSCFLVFLSLSALYGLIMGSQNLIHGYVDGWKYALTAAVKLPLLFLLTLAICLPLLYVLNVLIGPKAQFRTILGLLMASIAVTSIVLASCGMIVLFFMLSTKSYPFIMILNVFVFTLAGGYGVWFLGKAMHSLAGRAGGEGVDQLAAQGGVRTIMNWWLITYGIVGTQMAWILRPFVGSPEQPYSFFRAMESNFYITMARLLGRVLGID